MNLLKVQWNSKGNKIMRYLKNQPFYKYHRSAFPSILRNSNTIFYGAGLQSQVFGLPEDDFVYIRTTNKLLESLDLYVNFEDEDNVHVPKVERIWKWQSEDEIQWYKAEKLYKISDKNKTIVRKLQYRLRDIFWMNLNEALTRIEIHFPQYLGSFRTLIENAQNWDDKVSLDLVSSNVMERKDGTIVFNDIIFLPNCRKNKQTIKDAGYSKLTEILY